MKSIVTHKLFWPAAALITLIVINAIARPRFIKITIHDGHLYGNLIDILRNSAPLMLVALGMTIVIATRGIDLSVGAIMAVSGAVALEIISGSDDPNNVGVVAMAVGAALVISLLLGRMERVPRVRGGNSTDHRHACAHACRPRRGAAHHRRAHHHRQLEAV